jgi:hypothetical protein
MAEVSEVRGLVDQRAREAHARPVSDRDFDRVLRDQHAGTGKYDADQLAGKYDADQLAADIWYDIQAERASEVPSREGRGPDDLTWPEEAEAPASWGDYGVNLFIRYEYLRNQAMGLMSLNEPLLLDQVKGFLFEVAGQERRHEGDELRLVYPTGQGVELDRSQPSVTVWRGIYQQEWKERVRGEHPDTRDLKTAKERITVANTWRAAREQRLARLADLSEEIADWTGVGKHEAVAFLLCNLKPRPPWLRATAHVRRGAPVAEVLEPFFTIHVGSPQVSPRAVMETYVKVRRWVLSGGGPEGASPRTKARGSDRLRPLDEKTMGMFHFVRARLEIGRDDWAVLYDDYEKEYPGQYKSQDSMRRAYNRVVKTRVAKERANPADDRQEGSERHEH